MAITVKDIQEKEFSTQAANGYNVEQVDDFLDEVASQLGATTGENQRLKEELRKLKEQLEASVAQPEQQSPDYNESGYFKNLESAMRESLIGAQRIADDTLAEANKKAQQTVEDANAQADKTVSDANAQAKSITENAEKAVISLKAEAEQVRAAINNYREGFKKLVDDQMAALRNSESADK